MERNEDILNLARGMKQLYDESMEDLSENSPLYSEIREIDERYTDRTAIAKGGMKTIYKVLDLKTDRYIAMAELHEGASESSFENFIREARLTANLEHPNIISIHDIGLRENDKPFFTMDLKVGDSLRVILKKLDERDPEYEKRYTLNVLLEIFSKICDAMDYAHSRAVLHLDLKPDNIQIGLHGEVLVCDWGLGKVIGEKSPEYTSFETELNPDLLNDITQAGELKGTPGYMAPEQACKDGVKNYQTDIYALGCILYSILTQKPTVSGSLDEMMEATRKGDIELPSKVCPELFLPKTLDSIFEKATQLDPEKRYSSVKQLKSDISNFLAGYSTSVEKGLFIHEIGLFYRRNKTACWTAMCLILVLFVVTALFIFNLNRRIKEADTANKIASHLSAKQMDEQDKYNRQYTRISNKFLAKLEELNSLTFYDDPVQTIDIILDGLNSILSSGNTQSKVFDFKLNCLLIKMNLDTLYALSPEGHPLKQLAKKYSLMVHDSQLPEDELVNLINDIEDNATAEKLLIYQGVINPGLNINKAVISYLKKLNPDCDKSKISYSKQTGTLTVGCKKFTTVSAENKTGHTAHILKLLKLKKIDFSGSGVKSFQPAPYLKRVELVFDSVK
ncbi:MAG: serine/threonine protein kinase [Lentisphaeraceae bacterium]|nr:serine/threonine protein kinase [Lentisphaeraceae bacterium]